MSRWRPTGAVAVLGCAAMALAGIPLLGDAPVDASAYRTTVTMKAFMVSAARVQKNPWYYASMPGYEILTRASEDDTRWWVEARQRGEAIEDELIPEVWRPETGVPHTIIIDNTDLAAVSASVIHQQPVEFAPAADALTWGKLADHTHLWSDPLEARDGDTDAVNTNLYGVDTHLPACETGLERLLHCAPALPRWVVGGLMDPQCGIFREAFMPVMDTANGGMIRRAAGPGTMWLSLAETKRLVARFEFEKRHPKEPREKVPTLPLGRLFAIAKPAAEDSALWESEAGLFIRWALAGPGRADAALARGFLEFANRARRGPVDEGDFKQCFGFGYTVMETKLADYLRVVLAQPDEVDLNIHGDFDEPDLKEATSDQIGRILGDWLRMEGDVVRQKDIELSEEWLYAAGRVLERAYREDNGLPPDAAPITGTERNAAPDASAAVGKAVVMKPFVVSASHIHDPALLAVYGLYEHDIGRDAKAREFIHAALISGANRPRANQVLAEILYAEALAHPEGKNGKLSGRQAVAILGALGSAHAAPPASDAYAIRVETWLHADAMPSERDLQEIDEGVAFYPGNTGLAYASALVFAKAGIYGEAGELVDKGLPFASEGKSKGLLVALRSKLSAENSPKDH